MSNDSKPTLKNSNYMVITKENLKLFILTIKTLIEENYQLRLKLKSKIEQ